MAFIILTNKPVCKIISAAIESHPDGRVYNDEKMRIAIECEFYADVDDVQLRIQCRFTGNGVATALSEQGFSGKTGEICLRHFEIDVSPLIAGMYETTFVLFRKSYGYSVDYDCVRAVRFEKIINNSNSIAWNTGAWGNVRLPDMTLENS